MAGVRVSRRGVPCNRRSRIVLRVVSKGRLRTVRNSMYLCGTRSVVSGMRMVLAGVIMMISRVVAAQTTDAGFGPGNPFYAPSALPFQAPPFDRIKDSDYQPAIED